MKNVLLIGFPTLGYIEEITKEIELLGHKVTYYDIEPWTKRFKFLKRLSPARYNEARNDYQLEILAKARGFRYDVILFVQPHRFRLDNLRTLKVEHPEATFVMYNWDSLVSYDYRPYLDLFSRVYTFDRCDAAELNITYLPLFATRDYQAAGRSGSGGRRIYFAGNIREINRYVMLRAFKNYCDQNAITFRCYMLMTLSTMIRLVRQGFIPLGGALSPMKTDQLQAWIRDSDAVFDYPSLKQTGYTMRTIENMCAGKKVITSNENIEKENFFDPSQFLVFRTLDFSEVDSFLSTPVTTDPEIYKQFHIQTFVKRLING